MNVTTKVHGLSRSTVQWARYAWNRYCVISHPSDACLDTYVCRTFPLQEHIVQKKVGSMSPETRTYEGMWIASWSIGWLWGRRTMDLWLGKLLSINRHVIELTTAILCYIFNSIAPPLYLSRIAGKLISANFNNSTNYKFSRINWNDQNAPDKKCINLNQGLFYKLLVLIAHIDHSSIVSVLLKSLIAL